MTISEHISTELSVDSPKAEPSRLARWLRTGVRGYQSVMGGRPSPCRFYPTCSQYAVEALEVHGAGRGTYLAIRRILRCNPLGPHGVDLVPLSKRSVVK